MAATPVLQYGMTIIEAAACGAPTLLMLPSGASGASAAVSEGGDEPPCYTFVPALPSTLCVGGHHVAAQAFSRLQTAQHGTLGVRKAIPPAAVMHLPPVGASDLLGSPQPLPADAEPDAAPAAFGMD
ncbi:hypothetical protein EON68_03475, partial [archaeon]